MRIDRHVIRVRDTHSRNLNASATISEGRGGGTRYRPVVMRVAARVERGIPSIFRREFLLYVLRISFSKAVVLCIVIQMIYYKFHAINAYNHWGVISFVSSLFFYFSVSLSAVSYTHLTLPTIYSV